MQRDPRPESPEAPISDRWFYVEGSRLFVRRPIELAFAELELGPVSGAHDPRVEACEDDERWTALPHTD
jgi:hypothetical protein